MRRAERNLSRIVAGAIGLAVACLVLVPAMFVVLAPETEDGSASLAASAKGTCASYYVAVRKMRRSVRKPSRLLAATANGLIPSASIGSALVERPAPTFADSSEHARRNGVGAPLRC